MTEFHEYGLTRFQLAGARLTRRSEDLDQLVMEWQTPDRFAFTPGGKPPGYPGMTIMDVETEEDTESCFLHRLQCQGVVGVKLEKVTQRTVRENLEGWDEGSERWLTVNPATHQRGDAMPNNAQLYCVSVEREEYRNGWWWISKDYRGLVGTKTYKRRITVNENIVSPGEPFVNELSGGWGTASKGQLSLPRVVVQDSYVSTSAPPTNAIPGASTPSDAPSLNTSIGFEGMELVRNWPAGWKLASLESDQIPGKNLWLITLSREYVWSAQPA